MTIVLKKADQSFSWGITELDSIQVYVNDVLVASASGQEVTEQWVINVTDSSSFPDHTTLIINESQTVTLPEFTYAPDVTDAVYGHNASPFITDGPRSAFVIEESDNASVAVFAPTITEGPSAGSASVTMF